MFLFLRNQMWRFFYIIYRKMEEEIMYVELGGGGPGKN